MKTIRTEAYLDHPPETVWAVLVDFASYAAWNPLNIQAYGRAALGARVRMTFLNPARPGTTITQMVTITACQPARHLAWIGHVPLFFRGHHSFTLSPEGPGTKLVHGERLSGLISWFISERQLSRDFVPHYEAVNRALAARLDALASE